MSSINQAAVRFLMANTAPNLFKAAFVARQTCLPIQAAQEALSLLVASGEVEELGLDFYTWRAEVDPFAVKAYVPTLHRYGFDLN